MFILTTVTSSTVFISTYMKIRAFYIAHIFIRKEAHCATGIHVSKCKEVVPVEG
jgi:hypothetical protein